jgi:hypothetical protein
MDGLKTLTTEQLLQEARDARAYADERYAYFDACRKELLARKSTGETNLEPMASFPSSPARYSVMLG